MTSFPCEFFCLIIWPEKLQYAPVYKTCPFATVKNEYVNKA